MKKLVLFTIVILQLFLITGCNSTINNTIDSEGEIKDMDGFTASYNNEISIDEMEFTKTDLSDFEYLSYPNKVEGTYSRTIRLEQLKESIDNLYLRNNNGFIYGIVKIEGSVESEVQYLFLLFEKEDSDNYIFVDGMRISKLINKTEFDALEIDKNTFDSVKKIDPAASIYDIDGEYPTSFHRSADGTMYEILYQNKNDIFVISNKEVYNDPMSFVSKLLPVDLNVIN